HRAVPYGVGDRQHIAVAVVAVGQRLTVLTLLLVNASERIVEHTFGQARDATSRHHVTGHVPVQVVAECLGRGAILVVVRDGTHPHLGIAVPDGDLVIRCGQRGEQAETVVVVLPARRRT